MKKQLFLVLAMVLLAPWMMNAQTLESYGFTTGVDASKWVDMTGATQILTPTNSDALASTVQTIGFTFPFGASTYTQYSVNTDGNLRLGSTATGTVGYTTPFNSTNANSNSPKINAFGCDGYGVSGSHYVKSLLSVNDDGDSMLVVEFCTGTFTNATRNNLYKWQIQLHTNGNIDIVFPSTLPTAPAAAHQCGICVNSSDGWVIQSSSNSAIHFTAGSTLTNAANTWFDANRYYTFIHPSNISCPAPTGVTASNITATSATLSWTAGGNETAWELVVDDEIYYPTDTTYTVNNLEGNTIYDVSVRAICGSGDTSFAANGTFRTACVPISTLPYTNDFEDDPAYSSGSVAYADALPACWTRINDATGTYNYYPYISSTTTYVHSGSHGMYWYHYTAAAYANNEYAVLPPIDPSSIDITDLTLAFYAKTTAATYHPQPIIGVMTDPEDATTFEAVTTLSDTAITTDWQLFMVSLASYTGTGSYIAIKWPRTSSTCNMAIDDIFLTDAWCDFPTDVSVTAAVEEITLTWSANGGTSFTVFIGNDTVTNITDTTYTFNNLTPDSLYNYGVATECASNVSMFIGGTIRTHCMPVASEDLPWTYGFEDATGTSGTSTFNTCLGRYREGTTTLYPYPSSTHYGDGSKSLYMYSTASIHSWVTLPLFETDLNELSVTFYAYRSTTATYGHWAVGVMTDPNDITTFDTIASGQVSTNSLWELVEVPLTSYTGNGQYLTILCPSGSAANYTYIDDIVVDYLPACATPTDLDTLNVTAHSVDLTWTSSASEYIVEYGLQGFVAGSGNAQTVFSNSITLNNLRPGATYGVYVTAICGSDTSNAAYLAFTTGCAPITLADLPYLEDFEAYGTGSSQTINGCWTKGTNNSTAYPYPYSTAAINGQRGLYFYGYYPSSASSAHTYSWAALPPVDESLDMSDLMVTFNAKRYSTVSNTYASTIYVGIADNVAGFTSDSAIHSLVTWIDTIDLTPLAASTIEAEEVSFENYLGTGKYVVFYAPTPALVGSSTYAYNYIYLDDITLRTIPTCFWPSSVALDAVTDEDATVVWTADARTPNPAGWIVEYGIHGFVPGDGDMATVVDTTATMSGLLPNTEYDVYISANCGGDISDPAVFTFRTLCSPVPIDSLPYVENFESYASGTANPISPCWYRKTFGNTTITYPYPNTSAAVTGNIGLYGYCYNTIWEYAALPLFEEGINNLMIDFDLKRGTSTGTTYHTIVYVGVMANASDITTFDTIAIIDDSENPASSVTHHRISFEGYEGTGRIAFLWPQLPVTTHYNYAHIDNVVVDQLPSCRWPAQLTVDNVTNNSIDISFLSDEGTDFRVITTNASGTVVDSADITTTSYTVTGLSPMTTYTISVATICSDDLSTWASVSATTDCNPIDSLPWIEDFDSYAATSSATEIPCWAHLGGGYVNFYTTSGNHLYSGTSLRFYPNSSTVGNILVLPTFDQPISGLEISLMSKPEGTSSGSLSVGYVTNPTDPSSFVEIQEYPYTHFQLTPGVTTVSYALISNTFAGAPANARIALRHNVASTSWYWFIDSINVHEAPVCLPVGAIEDSVSTTSVTLTWSHAEGQNTWLVTGSNGFSSVVTDSTITITGLTPNTPYTFNVYSICSIGDTSDAATAMVRTDCAAITSVPFIEDFESQPTGTSSTNSVFPFCWTRLNNGTTYGGYPYVSSTTTYNHTVGGTKGIYWYGSTTANTYGDYMYMILPRIDTDSLAINNLMLSLWAKASSTSYHPVFQVGVMNNNTDTAFTPVDTINIDGNTTWTEYIVNFSGYTGTGSYIAIRALRPSSSWYAYVDDISLDVIPTCPRVENLTANALLTSVNISWSDTSSNTGWNVEYGLTEFTPGTGVMTPIHVTDTFAVITGLDSATTYHAYVYPDCGTDVFYRHITFTTLADAPATVPYVCDFEAAGVNGWDFYNVSQTNHWMVGNATNNGGSRSLYITNDDSANAYTITATSYAFATRTFNLTAGNYVCSFDWKAQGESSFDFIRAALVPASTVLTPGTYSGFNNTSTVPEGGIAIDGGGRLNLHNTWQTQVEEFTLANPGVYTLVFLWRNDPSGGSQPPAAIDNVSLQFNTCPRVEDLDTVDVASTQVTFDWTDMAGASSWQVRFSDGSTVATTIANAHPFTLAGLTNMTGYTITVRPICSIGDTGAWSLPLNVITGMCDNPIVVGFDTINGTTYNTPVNNLYKYTLSETIIDSAELAGMTTISAIAYNYVYATAMTDKTNVTIYLQPTNKSVFSANTDIVALDSTTAVQVYSGDLNCSQGWNYFSFDAPYIWDGHSNLLVIVDDNSFDYNSSSYTFAKSPTTGYKTITYYSDSQNPDPWTITSSYSGTKTYYQYRVDMRLIYCASGCFAPEIDTAIVGETEVTLNWHGSASDYEVAAVAGSWIEPSTTTAATGTTATLTGLTPGTQYAIGVRAVCGDDYYSEWNVMTVTTLEHPCYDPSDVTATNPTFTGATIAWTAGEATQTNFELHITAAGVDTLVATTSNPCTVTGLPSATAYTVTVRAVCGENNYSDWSAPANFTTATCQMVEGVRASATTATTATITWTANGSSSYEVAYGITGTSRENCTRLTANTNSITINGLDEATTYDVYVRSVCSEGVTSDWSDVVTFETQDVAIDDVDNAKISLYPNPASSTVTLTGIEGDATVTVVDMNGREVYTQAIKQSSNQTITIDVSSMSQGAYFVRITGERVNAIRKLIVK